MTSVEVMTEKRPTRERIIEAAATVFAEQGLKGATTREIARVAAVNETTLFRHFQNKDLLLKAVVEQLVGTIYTALTGPGMSNGDLRKDLAYYAQVSSNLMHQHEDLIRTFIGECNRQPEEAQKVGHTAWLPVRQKLTEYLKNAQALGQVLPHLDPASMVEVLVSGLKGGMLRHQAMKENLPTERYLHALMDIFIRGISTPEYQQHHLTQD